MARKTWIKLKRGLLAPKHREAIGIRIWLYLFILDRANWEEGAVLTWRDQDAAEELEMPIDTVRQQRRQLEVAGYIRTEHQGDHLRLIVCKWVNPREYSGQVYNPPSVAVAEEGKSLQNPPLSENEGGDQGGNESGHESGYESGELCRPLKGITDHSSHITGQAGQKPPRPSAGRPPEAHPAIRVFREETQCYPKKATQPEIENLIGRREDDLALWRQVVHEWIALGWNPMNVRGMLGFFSRQEIPTTKGGKAAEPKGFQAVRQAMAEAGHGD